MNYGQMMSTLKRSRTWLMLHKDRLERDEYANKEGRQRPIVALALVGLCDTIADLDKVIERMTEDRRDSDRWDSDEPAGGASIPGILTDCPRITDEDAERAAPTITMNMVLSVFGGSRGDVGGWLPPAVNLPPWCATVVISTAKDKDHDAYLLQFTLEGEAAERVVWVRE